MTEDQPQAAMRSVPERIEYWLRTRAIPHRRITWVS
jgi:hypothetical protein